jgi:large subunit ribosomal protein L15
MKQNTLKPAPGSRKRGIRLGRGRTRGNFSGRGVKGAGSRSGAKSRAAFEGGQTPLVRRMPKLKGFKNPNKDAYRTVNLNQLDVFEDGATVDAKTLAEKRVVNRKGRIKLLGTGELKAKLKITVHSASETAIKAVEKAGGTLTLLETKSEKSE